MKIIAVFIAALVAAGYAGAGPNLTFHERQQDKRITETRWALYRLYELNADQELRLMILECGRDKACIEDAHTITSTSYPYGWAGWGP